MRLSIAACICLLPVLLLVSYPLVLASLAADHKQAALSVNGAQNNLPLYVRAPYVLVTPPSPPPPSPPPPSPPPPSHPPPPPRSPPPPSPPPPSPPPPPPSPPPPPPSLSLLSSISLSDGSLSPSFDPLIFTYTTSVSSKVSTVQVTVTLPDDELDASYFTIYVNGSATEAGVASADMSLGDYGCTVPVLITVNVYGYLSSTYTISITRGAKKGLAAGYIALIVVGAIVVLALLAYGLFIAYKKGFLPCLRPRSCSDDYKEVPGDA
ncbi:hypothetical protein KP509_34G031600 [Ceratopteris richardii]|uniref:Cadherin-like beta-sandwich-like domain-containing protein n=1 Tax=Ceratopteris richardii TaxID=49495 RepID=A0A8T2QK90_CERRI|nr:hypothetical protein KP509_34G031600 [Ceratopteris richardii]